METSVYVPQQELISKALSLGIDSNGSHENLPSPDSTKSTPFAFDLGREYALAQEHGEVYLQYFIENAHYYAKESYGRVPVSEYEHKIMEDNEGNVLLTLGPENQAARESYLLPALDRSKPDWYQRRSLGDVRWVDQMQEKLVGASEGDTFLDLSPTEFNVSIEVRKKWGFAGHSFGRLHKVAVENGQKKLISMAIRNYLSEDEHEIFFQQLTGKSVKTEDMLGLVEQIDPDITPATIRALADRIHPSSNNEQRSKSETVMDRALSKINPWLVTVFEMMQQGVRPAEIVKHFRGWENAVKDYVEGKNDLSQFANITVTAMREAVLSGNPLITNFTNRTYQPGANGCGLGSGFGTDRNDGVMDYESMTKATEADCPEIRCKKCPWKANEREVQEITDGKRDKCPKCGWKP